MAFKHHTKFAYVLILPQLLITGLFFIWPAINVCLQSLFFTDAFGIKREWAGLINFKEIFNDFSFLHAVGVTVVIAFFLTLLTMTLGLLLAVAVSTRKRSQFIYKSLMLWPYAVAPAIAAILWRFLFQPSNGWVAHLLSNMGIEFNYLIHPYQALAIIILAGSWQQFSYNFLFFLAALKAIPKTLIEASVLDGANAWQRFWQIIFPLLSPTTFFLLIMNLIYAFFDTFGIIDILTHGGPENSTVNLIYKIYKDSFTNMDLGSAAAESVLLMIMVIGLTLLQFRYIERKVHYL